MGFYTLARESEICRDPGGSVSRASLSSGAVSSNPTLGACSFVLVCIAYFNMNRFNYVRLGPLS